MDSYDPATGILTIPLVIVGNVAYTNVQVFVPLQNVVSVGNINDPNAALTASDQYSIAFGQLTIGALQVGNTVYSDVVVAAALSDVRSVGAVMSVPVTPLMALINPLPPAIVGKAYTATVVRAVAPNSLYTFSVDSLANGALPGGMIIDLNGNLRGTTISTGRTDVSGHQIPRTYTFGVCATDTISRATTFPCPTTSITVNPAPVTVSVSKAGTGSGSIASVPAGIACGATCSTSVDSGTQVTLTATAAPGSTFAGWSGACAGFGTGACVVTVNANTAATATFNLATPQGHTLVGTWNWSGPGSNNCLFNDGGAFSMTVTLNGTSFSATNIIAQGVQFRDNATCALISTDTQTGDGSGTLTGSTVTINFSVSGTLLTFSGSGTVSGNSVNIPITRVTGGSGSLNLTLQ